MKKSYSNESADVKIASFLAWVQFKDSVDHLMKTQGFQKVPTPNLVISGAMESQLEPFKVQKKFGSWTETLQLPTSPEFHLKKALAMGFRDIFEIKTCFRNEEKSDHHRAEFTMLEFYKVECSMLEFILLVQNFIGKLSDLLQKKQTQINFKIYKISDLFTEIGISLKPDTDLKSLKKQAQLLGIYFSEDDDFDDIYHRIWLEKIEPFFDPEVFTIVHSYPPSQAALAKIGSDGWANRFEIYSQGLELGNAFEELSDPTEIQKRWVIENAKRVRQGKEPHPMDQEFIDGLSRMPPCSGIALGLERLFMVFYDLKRINDFQIFE